MVEPVSGPMGEGPLPPEEPEEERNVVPPVDDEKLGWHAEMADSGTHWVSLNYGHFEDAE